MAGMMVFPDLPSAIRAGYQVSDPHYEVRPNVFGMKVRAKVGNAWAEALVVPRLSRGDSIE